MTKRCGVILLALAGAAASGFALAAGARGGHSGHSAHSAHHSGSIARHAGEPGSARFRQGAGLHGQGHGGISARMPLSAPPPLDPSRKISEQNCSGPILLDGGNLRCK